MQLHALELKEIKRCDTGVSGPQDNLSVGTAMALQKSQQSHSPCQEPQPAVPKELPDPVNDMS